MTRNDLIKIIHVAKRNLHLDDLNYQAVLLGATKKESCQDMNYAELKLAYEALKKLGFRKTGSKKSSVKTASRTTEKRPAPRVSVGEVIVAVWVTMGRHGFLKDTSRLALDTYIQRMTARDNGGVGVASLAWLDDKRAAHVLESLKRWHMRMMSDEIKLRGKIPRPGYHLLVEQFEMKK
ncbi:gp16 family protein [Aeromonas enteropelogenes]|uniref:gp16 family protein n=1 Tax=Aeromonas enteropelogenes TaxID=29489 RepID=UPI003BA11846